MAVGARGRRGPLTAALSLLEGERETHRAARVVKDQCVYGRYRALMQAEREMHREPGGGRMPGASVEYVWRTRGPNHEIVRVKQ